MLNDFALSCCLEEDDRQKKSWLFKPSHHRTRPEGRSHTTGSVSGDAFKLKGEPVAQRVGSVIQAQIGLKILARAYVRYEDVYWRAARLLCA